MELNSFVVHLCGRYPDDLIKLCVCVFFCVKEYVNYLHTINLLQIRNVVQVGRLNYIR